MKNNQNIIEKLFNISQLMNNTKTFIYILTSIRALDPFNINTIEFENTVDKILKVLTAFSKIK